MELPLKLLVLLGIIPTVCGIVLPVPGATKEECGRLGIMHYDPEDLPEGFEFKHLRHCADHPMSARNYWGWGDYLPRWFP